MTIIDTLKSILGLGGDRDEREGAGEPTVTVEHDPDASTEAAVKGAGDAGDGEPEADDTASDSAAADTDAAASTGSLLDEEAADDAERAAEPAEAVPPETETAVESDDTDEAAEAPGTDEAAEAPGTDEAAEATGADEAPGTDEETGAAEAAEATGAAETDEAADAGGASDSVRTIKGVGPAYGERLAEVGVETVADLAAADSEDLAAETDLPASRVEQWVERAKQRE